MPLAAFAGDLATPAVANALVPLAFNGPVGPAAIPPATGTGPVPPVPPHGVPVVGLAPVPVAGDAPIVPGIIVDQGIVAAAVRGIIAGPVAPPSIVLPVLAASSIRSPLITAPIVAYAAYRAPPGAPLIGAAVPPIVPRTIVSTFVVGSGLPGHPVLPVTTVIVGIGR
jgi:hypothetical protein